jgi:hypothetical protein
MVVVVEKAFDIEIDRLFRKSWRGLTNKVSHRD